MTSRTSRRRIAPGFLAAATVCATADAHEFWLMPSDFRIGADSALRIELFHGERFAGDIVARDTPQIERFQFISSAETLEVRGLHARPVSFVRPMESADGVIIYQSREYLNPLPADRFEAYLREEGLGEISRRRAEIGESDAPGREAYIRGAKALIEVGGPDNPGAPHDHAVGLPLEIVLDPGSAASPGALSAQVLYEGAPIAGLRVVAVHQASPDRLIECVTDADGRVSIPSADPGNWMLTTLHLVRTDAREDVDWKSYWASLTFAIGG